jgi:acetyltransferase-like isoleucine patch superfamily enzyme
MAWRPIFLLRDLMIALRVWAYRSTMGMDIGPGVKLSLQAHLDLTNPSGVHIGADTYIAFGAVILAHDMSRVLHTDTYVGANCFVGANAIIMPGVHVGDHCIVGSGAVVTRDVPTGSIVVGNPARIARSGISTGRWGVLTAAFAAAVAEEIAQKAEASDGHS